MPKTGTREQQAADNTKIAANGTGEKPDQPLHADELPEVDLVELAQQEYLKRRDYQLKAIKHTDKALLHKMLYEMVLGRRFEEKCAEVYRMGKIGGFCHLYIGQEAIAVGSMLALEPSDMVITSYRDHVQAMVKGLSPESVMAEL